MPFANSDLAREPGVSVVEDSEPGVNSKLAYYLAIEGTEQRWFEGTVKRVTKSNWCDVMFSDGKLWCKVEPSERGLRWVLIEK